MLTSIIKQDADNVPPNSVDWGKRVSVLKECFCLKSLIVRENTLCNYKLLTDFTFVFNIQSRIISQEMEVPFIGEVREGKLVTSFSLEPCFKGHSSFSCPGKFDTS